MSARQKNLDAQVDLIAFISLLAVLICSLLISSIWLQVASINVKQSTGAKSDSSSNKKSPVVWVRINNKGNVVIQFQNVTKEVPRSLRKKVIAPKKDGRLDAQVLGEFFKTLKQKAPKVKSVFFKPSSLTSYQMLIDAMDAVKGGGYQDLAVVPL